MIKTIKNIYLSYKSLAGFINQQADTWEAQVTLNTTLHARIAALEEIIVREFGCKKLPPPEEKKKYIN